MVVRIITCSHWSKIHAKEPIHQSMGVWRIKTMWWCLRENVTINVMSAGRLHTTTTATYTRLPFKILSASLCERLHDHPRLSCSWRRFWQVHYQLVLSMHGLAALPCLIKWNVADLSRFPSLAHTSPRPRRHRPWWWCCQRWSRPWPWQPERCLAVSRPWIIMFPLTRDK